MKKIFVILATVVTAVLLAVPLCGCQGEISFTTASLSDAKMATDVDSQTMAPLDSVTQFAPDSPVFYCTVRLSNAPDETEIKAEWIYVQGEMEELSDFLIYEDMVTVGGEGYIAFSLESDGLWPTGDYQVKLYVDGKESTTVDFTVE